MICFNEYSVTATLALRNCMEAEFFCLSACVSKMLFLLTLSLNGLEGIVIGVSNFNFSFYVTGKQADRPYGKRVSQKFRISIAVKL